MRHPSTRLITAACLAATLLPSIASAANDLPPRKGGWWESTSTSPRGTVHSHVCSDAASEVANRANNAQMEKLAGCTSTVTKTATGWSKFTVCRDNGQVTSTNDYKLTGDLASSYTSETTVKMSSGVTHGASTNKLLGACPAGRKPGQRVTADGKVEPYPPPVPKF